MEPDTINLRGLALPKHDEEKTLVTVTEQDYGKQ